jgi:hypothetical protein
MEWSGPAFRPGAAGREDRGDGTNEGKVIVR